MEVSTSRYFLTISRAAYPTSAYPWHYPRHWLLRISFLSRPYRWFPAFYHFVSFNKQYWAATLSGILHLVILVYDISRYDMIFIAIPTTS